MNLSQLTAQFLALMNRSDLNANPSLATTFISQAIMRLQRELRVTFMESITEYTVPSNYSPSTGIPIPTDLVELIDLNVDSDNSGLIDYPLQRVQLKEAMWRAELVDIPQVFARRGNYYVLGPRPLAGSVVEIIYYAAFTPLVNPTDTNALTTNAWDAVLYGALSAAADFYNDDRSQVFEARYTQITQNIQAESDADALTADAAILPALPIGCDY